MSKKFTYKSGGIVTLSDFHSPHLALQLAALLLLAMLSMPSNANDDSIRTFAKEALLNAYKDKLLDKYAALQQCTDFAFCYLPNRVAVEKLTGEIRKIEEEDDK